MFSSTTRRRELIRPDATIRYWVSGPAGAPRVVLLHGATLDHHAWDAQVRALKKRYRVVVPDLRGHGESTMEGPFRFEDALADVLALLDAVDRPGTPVTLGGLSLGGNLAQEVVYRAPDRVDALVVADATCNTSVRHPLAAAMTIASLAAQQHSAQPRRLRPPRRRGDLAPRGRPPQYVVGTNADRTNAETYSSSPSCWRARCTPTGLRAARPDAAAARRRGPRGRHRRLHPGLGRRDDRAEYVVVPGAGHASNQDNPAAFNAALLAFLARVHAPAGRTRIPA